MHPQSDLSLRRIHSPIGILSLVAGPERLIRVAFGEDQSAATLPSPKTHPVLDLAEQELAEYFSGKRKGFSLPLEFEGTPFLTQVWSALRHIPFGQTASYKEVATTVGSPRAARAVGAANNRNPLAIVIPCHRVVGADGALVGFGGGLEVKAQLLELERRNAL